MDSTLAPTAPTIPQAAAAAPRPQPEGPEALLCDNPTAAKLCGIAEPTLYALRRAGKWGPAPLKLGRCCRWRVAEIREWISAGCPPRTKWAAMTRGGGR